MKVIFSLLMSLPLLGCAANSDVKKVDALISVPVSYTMRVSQKCYCLVELQGPFDVKVIDNKAVSIVHVELKRHLPLKLLGDDIPSLESMLAVIEKARVQGAHKKDIEWIKKPFVPKHIYIDYVENIKDEEVDITVENFELL